MISNKNRWSLLAIFLSMMVPGVLMAQWVNADGGPPSVNPNSGVAPNPVFLYNSVTGGVSVRNVGDNGIIDSIDHVNLLGDDFGFISLLFEYPGSADTVLPGGWTRPFRDDFGITFGVFNDKVQILGQGFGNEFLEIFAAEGELDYLRELVELPPGLTADFFRGDDGIMSIETGWNYAPQMPGFTYFSDGDAIASGAFRIVPEPQGYLLSFVFVCFAVGNGRRRRD